MFDTFFTEKKDRFNGAIVPLKVSVSEILVEDKKILAKRVIYRVQSMSMINGGEEVRQKQEIRPLYRLPHVTSIPFVFQGVGLGIAESFLDAMIEQITPRETMGIKLATLTTMQLNIAEVAAEVDCARLLVERDTSGAMQAMRDGRSLTMMEKARNRRDHAYVARLCKSAVDRLHGLTAANGLFDDNFAQRKFRDMHAVSAHISAWWDISGPTYGEVALGLEPTSPFI